MMLNIQLTHHMPVDTQKSFRIRTGYERIVAQRAGDMYAVSAKMDGEVIAIDEKAGLFKVRYVDGSMEVYTFGEEYGICADIVTTQKQELLVTVGQKFKKDEILCYNPQFFEKDPYSNQVDWKLGTPAKVALVEIAGTYEDSSTISKNFAEKISIQPVEIRDINLTTSNYIHKFAKLGDIVDINDPLLIFENDQVSDMSSFNTTDNEALDYLVKLNRKTPKAKFAGTIVNIEVFSGCPYEELNDSFKALYREANRKRARRAEFAKDTKDFMLYPPVKTIPEGSKFKGVMFNRETVMIRYYIQETVLADVGSKIVIDSSMKSIISDILENSVSTESGKEIDVIFSCSSISNRIVCSPLIEGIAESVMESLEKEITNMGI